MVMVVVSPIAGAHGGGAGGFAWKMSHCHVSYSQPLLEGQQTGCHWCWGAGPGSARWGTAWDRGTRGFNTSRRLGAHQPPWQGATYAS